MRGRERETVIEECASCVETIRYFYNRMTDVVLHSAGLRGRKYRARLIARVCVAFVHVLLSSSYKTSLVILVSGH